MGRLFDEVNGRCFVLEDHHVIGRSPRCSQRLNEASVSSEHAVLRWNGRSWTIKDLGSRYRTFVDRQPIQSGVTVPLARGTRLAFGVERHTWTLADESPPEVMLVRSEDGAVLFRSEGMLAIPSQEHPIALVYQSNDGNWLLEHAGKVSVVHEQVPFAVEGSHWRLCNASPVALTSMSGGNPEIMSLEETTLQFEVSRNEEHVGVTVIWRDRSIALPPRSHNYMLLTLARLRVKDMEDGENPTNAGWTDQDDVLKLLHLCPEQLNLNIFRARKLFGYAGIVPSVGIVERRPTTREMRIGVAGLKIESA